MQHYFVYITTENMEEAREVGKVLIQEKLVACVNMLEQMESMFMWNGEFQNEKEVVLIAKTKASLVNELIDKVKEVHSYDCPCIVTLPLESGNQAFLDWIDEETK